MADGQIIPFLLLTPLLIFSLAGCGTGTPAAEQSRVRVVLAGQVFHLELALDDAARFHGLSDRSVIPDDGGMLFVFPQPHGLTFVMRRCLAPIDVVFLDPAGRIVAIREMQVEPYDRPEHQLTRYDSVWAAQFAVELRGGRARQLGLKPGMKIDLPLDDLKHQAH